MSQLALFFALQMLGSWACLAVGPKRELGLCLAMGFLIGLAIAVFLALPLLLLGVFTAASVVAMLAVALAAAIGSTIKRGRATSGIALRSLAWAIGFTALCVPFCAWNLEVLTYDSNVFIEYAVALQDLEKLPLETLSYLHSWGSFQIVAHALAVVTAENHLYALAPAFSISLFATFAVVLCRGLRELGMPSRASVLAAALVVLALLAIPLVRLHVIYIHANWGAGGYLFVFAALFWLADVKHDAAHLPAAFLALLAFSFSRVESPMFVAPFLVLTLSQTRLPRSAVIVPYLAFTVVLTAWLLLMAALVPEDSVYLTPMKSLLMVAAVVGIFSAFLARETALGARLAPRLPRLLAIVSLVAVALAAATRFEVFRISFPIWQRDLWTGTFWGFVLWPAVVVLAVLALRVEAPPWSRPLRYGVGVFFVMVALLACLGADYGSGRYGSLTRVTLQIVPLLVFYFALVFAPVVARAGFWKNRFQ